MHRFKKYYRQLKNLFYLTDDIEIEDAHEEESKDKNKAQQFTAFSKQKLGKGLQALKGQSCMYTVFLLFL